MNPKEIERRTSALCGLMFKDMTEEQLIEYSELSWRDYINSCLIYDQRYLIVDKEGNLIIDAWHKELYLYNSNKQVISEERALEIYHEQVEDFEANCIVHTNVGTDCEGVSYNSATWN